MTRASCVFYPIHSRPCKTHIYTSWHDFGICTGNYNILWAIIPKTGGSVKDECTVVLLHLGNQVGLVGLLFINDIPWVMKYSPIISLTMTKNFIQRVPSNSESWLGIADESFCIIFTEYTVALFPCCRCGCKTLSLWGLFTLPGWTCRDRRRCTSSLRALRDGDAIQCHYRQCTTWK